jgi:hypothetical protein
MVVTLVDSGSSRSVDYSFTANTVTATGGFGGISFSNIFSLDMYGATTAAGGTTNLDVTGILEKGVTFFQSNAQKEATTNIHVDAAPTQNASLNFVGGDGPNSFNIERTPAWIFITESSLGKATRVTTVTGRRRGG